MRYVPHGITWGDPARRHSLRLAHLTGLSSGVGPAQLSCHLPVQLVRSLPAIQLGRPLWTPSDNNLVRAAGTAQKLSQRP